MSGQARAVVEPDEIELLDEDETSTVLKNSPRTLQKWRVEGRGPKFIKVGKRALYTRQDLREFIRAQRRTSTSDRG